MQAQLQMSSEEALQLLFDETPEGLAIARKLFDWIIQILPYRCGMKKGNNRISFLIGNYRPIAIKRSANGKVRLDMGFMYKLPGYFYKTSEVWKTIPDTEEGYTIVESFPLQLKPTEIANFLRLCEEIRKVAPKSRKHICNIRANWSEDKPFP